MLEERVSFLLKGAEEAPHSLLSGGRVAQQCCVTGAGVHGFAISTLLKKFGYAQAIRLQLLRRFSLLVQLSCFLQHNHRYIRTTIHRLVLEATLVAEKPETAQTINVGVYGTRGGANG